MSAMERKQEEGIKELKKTAAALKKEQKEFIKEQKEKWQKVEESQKHLDQELSMLKDATDKASKKMDKELKQLTNKMQNTKTEVEKNLESKKRYLQAELVDTKDLLKKLQDSAKECRTKIHERIDRCVGRVSTIEDNIKELSENLDPDGVVSAIKEYPVNCTAVARFVKQPEGVSPQKLGELIVNEALELKEMKVVRVKSMSRNDNNVGTLKIQLETPSDLHEVLESKSRLNEYDEDPDMKNIKMRQSKSHEQLVAEQNADAMLKALDLYDDFYRTDKGFLLPRNQQEQNNGGGWRGKSHRGRGRGHSRPNEKRPGRINRQNGPTQRGANYNSGRDGQDNARPQNHDRQKDDQLPHRRLSAAVRRLFDSSSESRNSNFNNA